MRTSWYDSSAVVIVVVVALVGDYQYCSIVYAMLQNLQCCCVSAANFDSPK